MRYVFLIAGLLVALALPAMGQLPPGVRDQIDSAIGSKVETAVVLSTANSINTGAYKWSLDNTVGNITRLTWEFDLGDKRDLGETGLKYLWSSEGGVGYAHYDDQFNSGPLAGNNSKFQSIALGEDIGPRTFLTDDISVLPSFGIIYGYTRNEFEANTSEGRDVLETDGDLVNWHVQTMSLTPGFQVQYEREFGPLKVRARSSYEHFSTFPLVRSTDSLSFRSDSDSWENGLDLDYNTGIRLLSCDTHLGANFSRDDLFGGLQQAVGVDHYYNAGGRVLLDTTGKTWIFNKLGLGATYTWGRGFQGYSVGLIVGISF